MTAPDAAGPNTPRAPVGTRRRSAERPRPKPARLRLLLTAALVLGVGAMHTLGHVSEGHHGGGPAPTAVAAWQGGAADADASPAAAVPERAAPGPGAAEPPPTDPTLMCLAVLGLAAVLLGVATVASSRWPGTPSHTPPSVRRSAGPLRRPPDAPSLARLQVLRI
ncbi:MULTISPECIES: DUF6153 family protein [Nocardiopsidaceae]|uniref:DUF6153 family protein n=1 Tax=Streptomonospora nanhaiensis TaxID=1323731 RepID=A0ABY6YI25_9ACTN|nr:DUF6153 family protein [Streptomonospora nanhaiensis]WAE71836.1 DUF6153 family protein [Streptomonospora nanhaiensis]